jgi:uncharacterized NAD(P)/FAD-binding protein YdhS
VTLAIVGGGPMCTYAMERLAATARHAGTDLSLDIHVFEKSGHFGAGFTHSPSQAGTSFLNRIIGQVAFAADESVVGAGPLLDRHERPTLLEWCRDRFSETGDGAFDLRAVDYAQRYVHGLALRAQFDRYVAILREHGVHIELHDAEVVDLQDNGTQLHVAVAGSAETVVADHVLMLTGQSSNDPRRYAMHDKWADFSDRHQVTFIPSAYPLEYTIDPQATSPDVVVGLVGAGLTAVDVILSLTQGRGGRFEKSSRGLRYLPSGTEPKSVVVFSRSGMFAFSRPNEAKETGQETLEHRGVFFTPETLARLRASVGSPILISGSIRRQLDFEAHVLPIVVLEMAILYYRTLFGAEFGDALIALARPECESFVDGSAAHDDVDDGPNRLLGAVQRRAALAAQAVDAVLAGQGDVSSDDPALLSIVERYLQVIFGSERGQQLCGWLGRPDRLAAEVQASESPWRHPAPAAENLFSWERIIRPVDAPDFHDALTDFMRRDHLWSAQDNLWNPIKAACDGVWRDLKGVLASAVNFGGLTADSHRQFLEIYLPLHNRICDGAPLEVMEKIAALMEHGLLDLSAGPRAEVCLDERSGEFQIRGSRTGVSLRVDTLIDCRVPGFNAESHGSPLYRNLLHRGMIRPFRNPTSHGEGFAPGGLDLTDRFHPVNGNGAVDTRLTFFGTPCEGMQILQIGLLRPDKNHYVMQNIVGWLDEFWPKVPNGNEH